MHLQFALPGSTHAELQAGWHELAARAAHRRVTPTSAAPRCRWTRSGWIGWSSSSPTFTAQASPCTWTRHAGVGLCWAGRSLDQSIRRQAPLASSRPHQPLPTPSALLVTQMAGQMLSEAGGWDAMSGQKVCAKPGLAQMPVRTCLPPLLGHLPAAAGVCWGPVPGATSYC